MSELYRWRAPPPSPRVRAGRSLTVRRRANENLAMARINGGSLLFLLCALGASGQRLWRRGRVSRRSGSHERPFRRCGARHLETRREGLGVRPGRSSWTRCTKVESIDLDIDTAVGRYRLGPSRCVPPERGDVRRRALSQMHFHSTALHYEGRKAQARRRRSHVARRDAPGAVRRHAPRMPKPAGGWAGDLRRGGESAAFRAAPSGWTSRIR